MRDLYAEMDWTEKLNNADGKEDAGWEERVRYQRTISIFEGMTPETRLEEFCMGMEGYIKTLIKERFFTFSSHYDDLYFEGMLAVMEAACGYDESIGAKTTYFKPYILHAMCRYINENVTFSTPYYAAVEKRINDVLRGTEYETENLADIRLSEKELHAMLPDISPKAIARVIQMKRMRRIGSMDLMQVSATQQDTMCIYHSEPDEIALRLDANKQTAALFSRIHVVFLSGQIDDKMLSVISDYYGLNGNVPMNLKSLSDKYGRNPYEIKKLIADGIKAIKRALGYKTRRDVKQEAERCGF